MALIPNRAKRIYQEFNVDVPAGLKTTAAYDAALYEEMGSAGRGVMEVTVICSFKFVDGTDAALKWAAADKTGFMTSFRDVCAAVWAEKFRITTASSVPAVKDVGVIFDIQAAEGMSVFSHSHWNLAVTRVPTDWVVSSVGGEGGGFAWNGSVTLDSLDFRAETKGASGTQRDAPHEFGHMLGHRDEYAEATGNANRNWLTDLDAIMNKGETVRVRHYALFADWLTRQYKVAAQLSKQAIDWKVSGTTDVANAVL